MRNISTLLFAALVIWCTACRQTVPDAASTGQVHHLEGKTMGTYYKVSYVAPEAAIAIAALDSVLVALNNEVSTYIPTSSISRFNQNLAWDSLPCPHFLENVRLSNYFARITGQAFDPTVMPIVNYWGFGYTPKRPVLQVDTLAVDSLMQFVGWEKLSIDTTANPLRLSKQDPRTQLDFSAIAKGYGVDLLGQYLVAQGIGDFFIDIGGEVLAKGHKPDGSVWRVGIAVPDENAAPTDVQQALPLANAAVATSGNYRNYYEVGSQKYSHTINPYTGFPERTRLLSASVLAPDCASADALATACMVLGLERAYQLIDTLNGVEAYFLYSDEQGHIKSRATGGFERLLEK